MENDYELQLTDFIDVEILQRMQNAFTDMTGIAAITVDANGVAVTEESGFCSFCMNYTRNSASGGMRCAKCDKRGAEMSFHKEAPCIYYCHAGLIDFSAPITAEGRLIGSFVGGQVLTQPLEKEYVRRIASEINVDPGDYIEASRQICIMEREEIEKAARFLYTLADVLSEMAYNKYQACYSNAKMEKSVSLKSDFLANMSHEIRTPMNAVIGMAEMALREDMSNAARKYINQIKTSGKSLLTIINDILDFSKIESGKMNINVVEYEPMSLVSDVAGIVMTRLKGKDVELVIDVSPTLPNELLGDNIRIKQVLINLANNAAKFTMQGKIVIKIDYRQASPGEILLDVCVEDTGIGIREADIQNLFQSFQQLDSKRNRNIEGTGLGLAISKQLLTLMDGSIRVESEYGTGSRFSFEIPQKIISDAPSIRVRNADRILVAGYISNPLVRDRLYADAESLGVEYVNICSVKELDALADDKKIFFFVEHPLFAGEVEHYVFHNQKMATVLLIEFYDKANYDYPNLLILKKPLFALNIATVLNGEEMHFGDTHEKEFDFVAPDANILIVDDNAVNLTVAQGLLEPLKMHVDTALTGKDAIDKISRFHYDLVFMDHMMPELDGVETTHIIRRFHKEYDDVPIIAFTANAVEGTKEMFCREGMNDFVAKPVEMRMMLSKLKQWLPIEKIKKPYGQIGNLKTESESSDIRIGNLDVSFALKYLGSEALFFSILKVYYRSIEKKAAQIKAMEESEDWTGYTIEVHALKSSSKQIGAILLSDRAAVLEKAGNARDSAFIHENTDDLLALYTGYLPVLEPFCRENEEDGADALKEPIIKDRLLRFFGNLRRAMDDLDMDQMSEVIEEMRRYRYEDWQQEFFSELRDAVEEIDVETCESILKKWESQL